jgi:hypothetical protein
MVAQDLGLNCTPFTFLAVWFVFFHGASSGRLPFVHRFDRQDKGKNPGH